MIPVWLLARRYVGDWLALVPAALVVSGSWMLTAAGLLTENAGHAARRGLPGGDGRRDLAARDRAGAGRRSASRCWPPSRARSSRS